MAVDEQARHRLYLRLEERLGPKEATTLMELLPPVGWVDVATKQDLALVTRDVDRARTENRLEHEALEARLGTKLEAALRKQLWASAISTATIVLAVIAIRG